MSKKLKDTEHSHRENLRLIENLSSKVDSLSNVSLEQGSSNSRIGTQEDSTNSLISENDILNAASNTGHNMVTGVFNDPTSTPHTSSLLPSKQRD